MNIIISTIYSIQTIQYFPVCQAFLLWGWGPWWLFSYKCSTWQYWHQYFQGNSQPYSFFLQLKHIIYSCPAKFEKDIKLFKCQPRLYEDSFGWYLIIFFSCRLYDRPWIFSKLTSVNVFEHEEVDEVMKKAEGIESEKMLDKNGSTKDL